MASLENKITEAVTGLKMITQALEKEVEERRRDAETLTRHDERIKTIFINLNDLEEKLLQMIVDMENDYRERIKNVNVVVDEGKSKGWQILFSVINCLIGAAVAYVVIKLGGKPA